MTPTFRNRIAAGALFGLIGCLLLPQDALAQTPATGGYDAIDAAYDAHRRSEERRLDALHRQLDTIDWMNWWTGRPLRGVPEYSRSELYAFGVDRRVAPPHLFTPWPFVPGDIWGFPNDAFVRQPIGQVQMQTGPRRWESHPVYADEDVLVAPAEFAPREAAPPASGDGPREF